MQALEGAGAPCAADPELERGTAVAAGLARGEVAADGALLVVGACAALGELLVSLRGRAPALDPAGSFEPRDRGDEMTAGHVIRGGEWLAVGVVRALLGHSRAPERAAHDDAPERARLPSDLARDDGAVWVSVHGGPSCWPPPRWGAPTANLGALPDAARDTLS